MNQEAAFKMYFGLNLHFSVLSYSVLVYGTNTKQAINKYNTLSPEQRYKFEWLARKYPSTQDLVYALLGCQFDNVAVPYAIKEDIVDSFFKFKARRESLTHRITSDAKIDELLGFPPIDKFIFKYFIGEISPEYVILRTLGTDNLITLYNSPNLSWSRDKLIKLIKYDKFFNPSKYIHLLEKNENIAKV